MRLSGVSVRLSAATDVRGDRRSLSQSREVWCCVCVCVVAAILSLRVQWNASVVLCSALLSPALSLLSAPAVMRGVCCEAREGSGG